MICSLKRFSHDNSVSGNFEVFLLTLITGEIS
jgi:hypothetical protein